MISTFIFDVDGTLVDTNYHHALAWFRAFQRFDITVPLWRIHRAIGMGGDQLVAAVSDDAVEDRYGDDLRDAWTAEYEPLLSEVKPFAGARAVLETVHRGELTLVLASSAPRQHVEHYMKLLDALELTDDWTCADDAENTKPAPDLVQTAMAKVDDSQAIMIGDSTWDAEAALRAGIATYAVRTGGFSVDELEAAGARRVYDSLEALGEDLDAIVAAD